MRAHQELADLAAFLASDQSGYVNGEQIVMDDGEQLKDASEFSHLGDLLTERTVADDETEKERL